MKPTHASFWLTGNNDRIAVTALFTFISSYVKISGDDTRLQVDWELLEKIKPTKWLPCPKSLVGAKHTHTRTRRPVAEQAALQAVEKSNMGATIIQRCHFLKPLRPTFPQLDPVYYSTQGTVKYQPRSHVGVASIEVVKRQKESWGGGKKQKKVQAPWPE